MKKWYNIVNTTGQIPQINIYGIIGDFEPGNVTFKDFQNEFRQIEAGNTECIIRVNSDGGSILEGLAIYDLAVNSKMKITTIVDGTAASMAGILVQAGDVRLITPNGYFMLHQAHGSVSGEAADIRHYADQVQELNDRIQSILVQRTGLPVDTINSLLVSNKSNWINAQDAVNKYNLADGILDNQSFLGVNPELADISNSLNYGKANWGFMDWFKNDATGLENMRKTNPTAYNKLYSDLSQQNAKKGYTGSGVVRSASASSPTGYQHPVTDRANWSFTDWLKNDSVGLISMKETNPAAYNKLYSDLSQHNASKAYIGPGGGRSATASSSADHQQAVTNRANWGFMDWLKNDGAGLESMKNTNPAAYNKLYNDFSQNMKNTGYIK